MGSPDRVAVEYQLHLVDCSTSTTRLEHQRHAEDPQKHMKKGDISEGITTMPKPELQPHKNSLGSAAILISGLALF